MGLNFNLSLHLLNTLFLSSFSLFSCGTSCFNSDSFLGFTFRFGLASVIW
jgi:hypothetical protein